MHSKIFFLTFAVLISGHLTLRAQYEAQDTTYKKCFVGSTFFLLGNFAKTNQPDFAQLNFGYRLTANDVVSIEIKTWKYAWPLGIPGFSDSYGDPEEEFPGFIREVGFALVYQHFWWKGLYTAVHMMPAWQRFVDENDNKVDNGFQLFNTYRIGYHIKLFNDHFFIEPSIAITHRPLHTEMPEAFQQQDNQWSKFNGEPGLHFGFNF